ncbi:hypothetical protein Csa_023881 [Cucumis sativus]|nr:hypothetical protein Csa_023881 [Cucumis sativus]
MLQSHVESRRAKSFGPECVKFIQMRQVPSVSKLFYIGNSRLAIEAIIVRRKERHAASGKNASGSFV